MEIIAKGNLSQQFWNSPFKADLNVSDIFSFLIKEVGCKVDSYASDLFYDLKQINEDISADNPTDDYYLIGLRDSGVDGKSFVEARMEHPEIYGCPYIKLYRIDTHFDYENRTATMVLCELHLKGRF